jgi:hypothetical protein
LVPTNPTQCDVVVRGELPSSGHPCTGLVSDSINASPVPLTTWPLAQSIERVAATNFNNFEKIIAVPKKGYTLIWDLKHFFSK